jgi:hypothetical protein
MIVFLQKYRAHFDKPQAGKPIQQKEGRLKAARESDSLIVPFDKLRAAL